MLSRFGRNHDANVAIIFALMMVPTIYLLGMALDYTQAYHKQSQLTAAADAAAISVLDVNFEARLDEPFTIKC